MIHYDSLLGVTLGSFSCFGVEFLWWSIITGVIPMEFVGRIKNLKSVIRLVLPKWAFLFYSM